ncbi:glycosyltransferase [Martelella sp. FOR1707]
MATISVALATYNGDRFLREQLESLVGQTLLPAELVVGDDGSTDGTVEILEDFRQRAPFPVRIYRNETNLGYARNFLTTAQRCNGDWIAFCDQDDVWLPNKLADATEVIMRTPDCCMVLQNAWICDDALSSSNRKFPDKLRPGLYGAREQYGFWVWLGFLQTVESRFFKLWDNKDLPRNYFPNKNEVSHDKWTCIIANAIGGIVVLGEPAALYRRHAAALTGDYNQLSLVDRAKKARSVTADHYDFLADVAADCARYVERLSRKAENPKWASALHKNAHDFLKLQKCQRLRSQLYSGRRFVDRLAPFIGILRQGGYFGAPFTAMGSRSAAKDALRLVLGKT